MGTSQQRVRLKIRPVATEYSEGELRELEHHPIFVETRLEDRLLDIEEALIREEILPPPPPGEHLRWLIVTADGEEMPVSPEVTVGELVETYSVRELKVSFHCACE